MAYAPGVGTGYVSVGDYLDANQGTLAREHSDLATDFSNQLSAAKGAADNVIATDRANYNPDWTSTPGYLDAKNQITGLQDKATALGTPGGVSDYFQKHLGDTKSQGGFDAGLFGVAPQYAQPAQDLSGYLDSGLAAVPAPPPPPGPEVPDQNPTDPEPPADWRITPGGFPYDPNQERSPWRSPSPKAGSPATPGRRRPESGTES